MELIAVVEKYTLAAIPTENDGGDDGAPDSAFDAHQKPRLMLFVKASRLRLMYTFP